MKGALKPGKFLIEDSGYRDERCFLPGGSCVPAGSDKQLRAFHETINECFKNFAALSSRFRH